MKGRQTAMPAVARTNSQRKPNRLSSSRGPPSNSSLQRSGQRGGGQVCKSRQSVGVHMPAMLASLPPPSSPRPVAQHDLEVHIIKHRVRKHLWAEGWYTGQGGLR